MKLSISRARTVRLDPAALFLCVLMFFAFCYIGTIRSIAIVAASAALFFWGVFVLRKRGAIVRTSGAVLLFGLFLIQATRLLGNAVERNPLQTSMITCVMYFLAFAAVGMLADRDNRFFQKVVDIGLIFCFIGGPVAGFYQFITGEYVFEVMKQSDQAILNAVDYLFFSVNNGNSNYAAIHMMAAVFLSLIKYRQTAKLRFLLMTILSLAATVMTFARATLLAMAISLLVVMLIGRTKMDKETVKKNKKIRRQLWAVAALVAVAALLMSNKIAGAIAEYFSSNTATFNLEYKLSSEGMSSRFQIWGATLQMLKDANIKNLICGFGDTYTDLMLAYFGRSVSTHNYILEGLASGGILGLAVTLIYCWQLLKRSFALLRSDDTTAKLLGMLALSILINFMFVSIMDFVGYTILLIIASYCTQRETDNHTKMHRIQEINT